MVFFTSGVDGIHENDKQLSNGDVGIQFLFDRWLLVFVDQHKAKTIVDRLHQTLLERWWYFCVFHTSREVWKWDTTVHCNADILSKTFSSSLSSSKCSYRLLGSARSTIHFENLPIHNRVYTTATLWIYYIIQYIRSSYVSFFYIPIISFYPPSPRCESLKLPM
jgi:hypothetical protein